MAWKLCTSCLKTIHRNSSTTTGGNTHEKNAVCLDAFILAQWPFLPWWFFPIFRLLWATYFTFWLVAGFVSFQADRNYKGKWFIFLTNWAFVALVIQSICLASIIIKHTLIPRGKHCLQEKRKKLGDTKGTIESPNENSSAILYDVEAASKEQEELDTLTKITWIVDNITCTMAIGVTISFWGFLFNEDQAMSAATIHTHGVNAAYILLDICLCKRPIRFSHFYQPIAFGLVYVLFTVVYFQVGGTDPRGRNFIYPFLNWEKPVQSLKFTAIFAVCLATILFFALYFLYRIRRHLHWRFYQQMNPKENCNNGRSENEEPELINAFIDIKTTFT